MVLCVVITDQQVHFRCLGAAKHLDIWLARSISQQDSLSVSRLITSQCIRVFQCYGGQEGEIARFQTTNIIVVHISEIYRSLTTHNSPNGCWIRRAASTQKLNWTAD